MQQAGQDQSVMRMTKETDTKVIFFLLAYYIIFAALRILVSRSMELDEAEQFLAGRVFEWGYPTQPPLYSWLVNTVTSITGMELWVLIFVKYTLLFCFTVAFFRLARLLWDDDRALWALAALALFPVYVYEFNRDLSHTVLVSLMAVVATFYFVRMLLHGRTVDYALFGLAAGLGILSKYNFLFFLTALICSALITQEGRRVMLSGRILIALSISSIVVLPHAIWLAGAKYPSLEFAMRAARAGSGNSAAVGRIAASLAGAYVSVLVCAVVIPAFFRLSALRSPDPRPALRIIRFAALSGLVIPLVVMAVVKAGSLQGRWLAPLFFMLPLAIFSILGEPLDRKRGRAFALLCSLVFLAALGVRGIIGFFPDLTGKVERIHAPYEAVAAQLPLHAGAGSGKGDLLLITDDDHLFANLKYWLRGARRATPQDGMPQHDMSGGIIVWNATRHGKAIPEQYRKAFPSAELIAPVTAPFLHSRRAAPFILGIAIVH